MSLSKYGKRFTVTEAAEFLDFSVGQLYRYAHEGRIACVRTDGRVIQRQQNGQAVRYIKSGRIFFYQTDLEAWVEAHRVPATRIAVRPPTRGRMDHAEAEAELQKLLPPVGQRRFS